MYDFFISLFEFIVQNGEQLSIGAIALFLLIIVILMLWNSRKESADEIKLQLRRVDLEVEKVKLDKAKLSTNATLEQGASDERGQMIAALVQIGMANESASAALDRLVREIQDEKEKTRIAHDSLKQGVVSVVGQVQEILAANNAELLPKLTSVVKNAVSHTGSPIGVANFDDKGRFRLVNETCAKMFGVVAGGDIAGRRLKDIGLQCISASLGGENFHKLLAMPILSGQEIRDIIGIFNVKEKQWVWYLASLTPTRTEGEQPVTSSGIIATFVFLGNLVESSISSLSTFKALQSPNTLSPLPKPNADSDSGVSLGASTI